MQSPEALSPIDFLALLDACLFQLFFRLGVNDSLVDVALELREKIIQYRVEHSLSDDEYDEWLESFKSKHTWVNSLTRDGGLTYLQAIAGITFGKEPAGESYRGLGSMTRKTF